MSDAISRVTAAQSALIDEIISMYHTTRLAHVPASMHILSKRSVQKAFAALAETASQAPIEDAAGHYLADRFEWAAPGDQQEDAWLVRFCDKDCREAIFTGPDAEREAWEHYNRYAPAYNLYVFRLARLAPPPPSTGEREPPVKEG